MPFHWDLSTSIEAAVVDRNIPDIHREAASEGSLSLVLQHPFSNPSETYEYVLGSFVAVREELDVDPM